MKYESKTQKSWPFDQSKTLAISVRSYNELNHCINLFNSIIDSYRYLSDRVGQYKLKVRWFENDKTSAELLRSYAHIIIAKIPCIDFELFIGDNSSFNYAESVVIAVANYPEDFVLLLSGHCIIDDSLLYNILAKINTGVFQCDCIILPMATNPIVGTCFEEYFFSCFVYNKIIRVLTNLFAVRKLASLMISNSNIVYRTNSLEQYPIPLVNGGEDSLWLSRSNAKFDIYQGTPVLHSHKYSQAELESRRRLLYEARKIYLSEEQALAVKIIFILLRRAVRFILTVAIYPYWLNYTMRCGYR